MQLGMVGGGLGGNIGRSHRAAALLDGHWDLVAGALRDDSSHRMGRAGLSTPAGPTRTTSSWPNRNVSVQTASTPSPSARVTKLISPLPAPSSDRGFDVICDKPLTISLGVLPRDLVRVARDTGRRFFVTYTYSGYPMVRLARDMVRAGELGELRSLAIGVPANIRAELGDPTDWQNQPDVIWPAWHRGRHRDPCLSHGGVCLRPAGRASVRGSRHARPGHRLDHATMHLRFDNGARGYLWNTTIAPRKRERPQLSDLWKPRRLVMASRASEPHAIHANTRTDTDPLAWRP